LITRRKGATITNRRPFRFFGGPLKEIVERVIAPLVGLRMRALAREADILVVHFGSTQPADTTSSAGYTLRIASAWRIAGPTEILAASGDLFAPADSDADLETFDWDVTGASWWDVRMGEVAQLLERDVVVCTFLTDSYGGVRLVCTGGLELEIFPNSSPSPHVETEFWRLVRRGQTEEHVVVGTSGIELVQPT
jgi:hypothetical protein